MNGTIEIRAAMKKQKISYQGVADRAAIVLNKYVSRTSVYRLLNPNDEYESDTLLSAIETAILKTPQWLQLLNWYKSGRSMTAGEFRDTLRFTQLHARHKEIYKYTGYRLVEDPNYAETVDRFIEFRVPEGKVICWRKEGEGRSKYNRYYLPEYTPK